MAFYPLMLDLRGKKCLVIGGGRVAIRKAIGLLRAEASVTVVAPDFHRHFRRIASRLTMVERPFSEHAVTPGLSLVIGATNSFDVNKSIAERAAALNILCNIVDCPQLCSCIVPAVVRRGDITIAISSGGNSPRLSRYIKSRLAETFGPDYARLAAYMAEVRMRIRAIITEQHTRCAFWEALFAVDPIGFLQTHGWPDFRKRTENLIAEYKQKAGRP